MRGRTTLALVGAALTLGVAPASAQNEDPGTTYLRYAEIRQDLISCHAQEVYGEFTKRQQRACKRLRRRYSLFTFPGDSADFFLHCRTSRCPATPPPSPPANGPIPQGATVYR